MAPRTSAEIKFVVRASGSPTLKDDAFVSSNEKDPDPANNEATEITMVAPGMGPPPTSFFTLTPCRILDTRGPTGVWGGPALQSGSTRYFPLVGRCGIPPTAISVSVNLTVTQATTDGHLVVYPSDITRPTSSSINYSAGQTRANNAVVRLSDSAGDHGAVEIWCGPPGSGTVHVIIDVNGYFE